jgi:hypothetical protein
MKFRSAFAVTFLLCPAIERSHADIFAWTYTTDLDGVLEWFTGASYRLARSWSVGLEFWNHHEFADTTVHEHSAYFVGPTIHYEGQRWFATLGFLRQLPIGQAFSHENKEFAAHDSYILGDEHEKYYVPLRVGFDFNTHRNWHFAFVV